MQPQTGASEFFFVVVTACVYPTNKRANTLFRALDCFLSQLADAARGEKVSKPDDILLSFATRKKTI